MSESESAAACLYLVERYAPKLMKAGGGTLIQDQTERMRSKPAVVMTQEQYAAKHKTVLQLARTRKFNATEIGARLKMRTSRVREIAIRAGIKLPDGRANKRRAA